MMVAQNPALLPPGFEALEPFAEQWAIAGSSNRAQGRFHGSRADKAAFYNAAKDLAVPALAYLDRKPLDSFDTQERRLMDMMLSLTHIALAVEVQGDDEDKHAGDRAALKIKGSPADRGSI
jgi:hypothetical protein